jgi:hypothetical protein
MVFNAAIESYADFAAVVFDTSAGIKRKVILAGMPTAIRGDDKFRKWFSIGVLGSFLRQWVRERFGLDAQSGYKGRTPAGINRGPRNMLSVGVRSIEGPIRLNHNPWSFQIDLVANSQPLSASKKSIDSANDKQTDIYEYRWRVPSFLAGIALFCGGFLLIGYAAYCFDDLGLKLRGSVCLLLGIILYVLGGSLMFIGPYLL